MGGSNILLYIGCGILGMFALYSIAILITAHLENKRAKPERDKARVRRIAYRMAIRRIYNEHPDQETRDTLQAWVVEVGQGVAAWKAVDVELTEAAFRTKHGEADIKAAEELIAASGYPLILEGKKIKDCWQREETE